MESIDKQKHDMKNSSELWWCQLNKIPCALLDTSTKWPWPNSIALSINNKLLHEEQNQGLGKRFGTISNLQFTICDLASMFIFNRSTPESD